MLGCWRHESSITSFFSTPTRFACTLMMRYFYARLLSARSFDDFYFPFFAARELLPVIHTRFPIDSCLCNAAKCRLPYSLILPLWKQARAGVDATQLPMYHASTAYRCCLLVDGANTAADYRFNAALVLFYCRIGPKNLSIKFTQIDKDFLYFHRPRYDTASAFLAAPRFFCSLVSRQPMIMSVAWWCARAPGHVHHLRYRFQFLILGYFFFTTTIPIFAGNIYLPCKRW